MSARVFVLYWPQGEWGEGRLAFNLATVQRALRATVIAMPSSAPDCKLELVGPKRFVSRLRGRRSQ